MFPFRLLAREGTGIARVLARGAMAYLFPFISGQKTMLRYRRIEAFSIHAAWLRLLAADQG